ncbi:MAG: phosphopantetheine-binding protein [Pseudonocardiaceae bacterium]
MTRLAAVLEQVAGVDPAEVTEQRTLADDLDLDSLTMVEVIVTVEDSFHVKVAEDVAQDFRTVGDLASYLEVSHAHA